MTLARLSNAQASDCIFPQKHPLHLLVIEPETAREGFFKSFLTQRITAVDAISQRVSDANHLRDPLFDKGEFLRARYRPSGDWPSCEWVLGQFGRIFFSADDLPDKQFPESSVPVTSALKYALQIVDYVVRPSNFVDGEVPVPVAVLFAETPPTETSLESLATEGTENSESRSPLSSLKSPSWNPGYQKCDSADPTPAQAQAVLAGKDVKLVVFASSNALAEVWKSYFNETKNVHFKVASLEETREEYESLNDSSKKGDFVAKTIVDAALSIACESLSTKDGSTEPLPPVTTSLDGQNIDVHKSELDEETTDANSEREEDDDESTPPRDNTLSPSGEAEKDDKDDQEKPPVFQPLVSEKATQQLTPPQTPSEPTTSTPTKPPTPAPTESTTPTPTEPPTPTPTESTTPTPTESTTSTPTKPPTPTPTKPRTPAPTEPTSSTPTESTTSTPAESTSSTPTESTTSTPAESTSSTPTESTTPTPTKPPTPTRAEPPTPTPAEPPTPTPAESPAQPATPSLTSPPTQQSTPSLLVQPASIVKPSADRRTRPKSGALSAAQFWLSILLTAMAISTNTFLVVVE